MKILNTSLFVYSYMYMACNIPALIIYQLAVLQHSQSLDRCDTRDNTTAFLTESYQLDRHVLRIINYSTSASAQPGPSRRGAPVAATDDNLSDAKITGTAPRRTARHRLRCLRLTYQSKLRHSPAWAHTIQPLPTTHYLSIGHSHCHSRV